MTSPPWVEIRLAAFAVSIVEPPPTETNPSKPPDRATSAASANDASVGSMRIWSNTSNAIPRASSPSVTRSVIPSARTAGSLSTSARVTPSRARSQPTSADAPGPNLSGVASTVKTDSCTAQPPSFAAASLPAIRANH